MAAKVLGMLQHPQEIKPMVEMYLAAKRAEQLPQEPNQAFCYDMLNKVSRRCGTLVRACQASPAETWRPQ